MTTPTNSEKIISIGTPHQKLSEVLEDSSNYFFVGVTPEGKTAYSVLLNEPTYQDVAIMSVYLDYIKMALVGQYEWLPLEECDD